MDCQEKSWQCLIPAFSHMLVLLLLFEGLFFLKAVSVWAFQSPDLRWLEYAPLVPDPVGERVQQNPWPAHAQRGSGHRARWRAALTSRQTAQCGADCYRSPKCSTRDAKGISSVWATQEQMPLPAGNLAGTMATSLGYRMGSNLVCWQPLLRNSRGALQNIVQVYLTVWYFNIDSQILQSRLFWENLSIPPELALVLPRGIACVKSRATQRDDCCLKRAEPATGKADTRGFCSFYRMSWCPDGLLLAATEALAVSHVDAESRCVLWHWCFAA